MRLCLDAGALIALERNDRRLWAALKLSARERDTVLVPSTVVAQVWRGGRGQALLSRALAHCAIAPFDGFERDVGELCGRTRTSDVCDAHVALIATRTCDLLYTSDLDELRVLVIACGGSPSAILRC